MQENESTAYPDGNTPVSVGPSRAERRKMERSKAQPQQRGSILPAASLEKMRQSARRASSKIASARASYTQPETYAQKLQKYGGDESKMTPAQRKILRKMKRRTDAA